MLVATGRRLRMAWAVLEAGGLAGPAVVLDGALGLDLRDGRVFHQVAFPARRPPGAGGVRRRRPEPCVYVDRPGVDLVVGDHPRPTPATWPGPGPGWPSTTWPAWSRPSPCTRSRWWAGPRPCWTRSSGRSAGGQRQHRPRPDLRRLHAPGAAPGVSKWSGVLAYCAEQGIDPARVLAVGDGANDLELLDGAAVACAVATATPDVLARADHVIGPPSSGGWAAVLDLVGSAGAG